MMPQRVFALFVMLGPQGFARADSQASVVEMDAKDQFCPSADSSAGSAALGDELGLFQKQLEINRPNALREKVILKTEENTLGQKVSLPTCQEEGAWCNPGKCGANFEFQGLGLFKDFPQVSLEIVEAPATNPEGPLEAPHGAFPAIEGGKQVCLEHYVGKSLKGDTLGDMEHSTVVRIGCARYAKGSLSSVFNAVVPGKQVMYKTTTQVCQSCFCDIKHHARWAAEQNFKQQTEDTKQYEEKYGDYNARHTTHIGEE